MKIIFFGTPDFAIPSIKKLIESEHDLLAVVTNPDKKSGRGLKSKPSPVKSFCIAENINCISYLDFSDKETYNSLKEMDPDLFVVVAFQILPEKIINIPKYGSINIHPSLLPKYRGSSPIQYSILNGDKETGLTVFRLNKEIDSGNVIIQKKHPIDDEIIFSELYNELSVFGADLLIESIELIDKGEALYTPQKSLDSATYAKKIKSKDCLIDWGLSSEKIYNKIRAFSKVPGAFTYFNDKKVKILKSRIYKEYPGILNQGSGISYKGSFLVGTKDLPIQISLLQIEGKKIVEGKDFINSNLFSNGKNINFG